MSNARQESRTWTERIEVAGNELVGRVKKLLEEGNVRRLIIRTPNDDFRLEIPLTAGVAVGGALTVLAPVLAALGALAALVANVNLRSFVLARKGRRRIRTTRHEHELILIDDPVYGHVHTLFLAPRARIRGDVPLVFMTTLRLGAKCKK
jgi:hypothetical protein